MMAMDPPAAALLGAHQTRVSHPRALWAAPVGYF